MQIEGSTSGTVHVVETSSFQLELIQTFHPWIAVMLNFSPDHLDRHPTVQAYAAAKARIFENQEAGDWAVINADDPDVLRLARTGRAAMRLFGRRTPIPRGTTVEDGWVVNRHERGTERLLPLSVVHLLGAHLVDDVLAAATVGLRRGVSTAAMTAAVDGFRGLEHAMELVADLDGVRFVNDSKATNVDAACTRLSFDSGLVPILGGRFKGGNLGLLREPLAAKARAVVAIGEASDLVVEALARFSTDFEKLRRWRQRSTWRSSWRSPRVSSLLAPACASFDMFRDYAERGQRFQEEVARIVRASGR